jgi:predicted nucleotidyltransferase
MNGKLLDLSGKIDPELVKVLDAVCQVAKHFQIPFFLVGATARDLMLQPFGIRPSRATGDTDLAIRVQSWNDYETSC